MTTFNCTLDKTDLTTPTHSNCCYKNYLLKNVATEVQIQVNNSNFNRGLLCLIPDTVSELFAQVSSSGKITLADQYGLIAALSEDSITEQEKEAIERLVHALCRGRIRIVNELSSPA